jgi:hypothetical protein
MIRIYTWYITCPQSPWSGYYLSRRKWVVQIWLTPEPTYCCVIISQGKKEHERQFMQFIVRASRFMTGIPTLMLDRKSVVSFVIKPGIDDWTCKIRLVFKSLLCRVRRVTRVYWLFGTWYFWISGQSQQWKSYVTTSQIFVSVTGALHVTMCISFHTQLFQER